MKNPYEVLGVSENATDEEIKAAYKALAKKYHPYNYVDSPLADLANEKMKEINEAYDTITDMRKKGGSANSGYSGYSGGNSNSYTGYGYSGSSQFQNIRMMINSGRIAEAEQALNSIPQAQRNAEWYFLNGMVMMNKGWSEQAYSCFRQAYTMDPNNPEYRAAFNRMNSQRAYGAGGYDPRGGAAGCSCCDICVGLWCADTCCSCMGGNCC